VVRRAPHCLQPAVDPFLALSCEVFGPGLHEGGVRTQRIAPGCVSELGHVVEGLVLATVGGDWGPALRCSQYPSSPEVGVRLLGQDMKRGPRSGVHTFCREAHPQFAPNSFW
jgi:hypothetical protein